MTQSNLGARLTAIITNEAFLVEAANAGFKVYCSIAGQKYEPFGADKVADVQDNLPVVWAVLNTSLSIARRRDKGVLNDATRLAVINEMASQTLVGDDLFDARVAANTAWRQRNVDKGLARAQRPICADYTALITPTGDAEKDAANEKEVAKDDGHIREIAKVYLKYINN